MTSNDHNTLESITKFTPGVDRRAGWGRRREPRWVPDGVKSVTVFGDVTGTIRDESTGGICLKLPVETKINMGQPVPVNNAGTLRTGRVCWTTVDHFGSHRFVGLAWMDEGETIENVVETSLDEVRAQ